MGNYSYAALEYEREIFKAENSAQRNKFLLAKVESLKRAANYELAFETIDRIPLMGLPDSVVHTVLYQKILCAYLAEKFTLAESYLLQAMKSNKPLERDYYLQINLLRILVLNELQRWDEAKSVLVNIRDSIDNGVNSLIVDELIEQYNPKLLPRIKKEKTLFWLSFIPGAGMAYAGKPLEGVLNFGINASALAFGVYQIYYGYYLTGYFGGAIILQKFYFGGRKRGEYLLEERNYKASRKYNDLIKSYVIQI